MPPLSVVVLQDILEASMDSRLRRNHETGARENRIHNAQDTLVTLIRGLIGLLVLL